LEGSNEQRSASLGASACHTTMWTSDSSVTCSISSGGSRSVHTHAVITIEEQISTLSNAFSSDVALLRWLSPSNLGCDRSSQMNGLNFKVFGPSAAARAGGSSTVSTVWKSDTSLLCVVTASTSKTMVLTLTLGQIEGSFTALISSDVTTFRRPNTKVKSRFFAEMQVSEVDFLNIKSITSKIRIGLSACEATYWREDTAIVCKVPRGIGHSTRVCLTTGKQVVSSTCAVSIDLVTIPTFAYHAIQIRHLSWNSTSDMSGIQNTLKARIGTTDVSETKWTAVIAVQCQLAIGSGRSMSMQLTMAQMLQSLTEAASYQEPILSRVVQANSAVGDVQIILVRGEIGIRSSSISGQIGWSTCERAFWKSETVITCMTVARRGASLSVIISAGNMVSSLSAAVSIDLPSSISLQNNYLSSYLSGWQSIQMHGLKFGNVDACLRMRMGSSGASTTSWTSDTAVLLFTAAFAASSLALRVTSGVRTETISEFLSFSLSPFSRFSLPQNSAADGKAVLFAYTSTKSSVAFSPAGRVGHSACEGSMWTSESTLSCASPRLHYTTLGCSVTSGGLTVSLNQVVTYDSLRISTVLANAGQTSIIDIKIVGSVLATVGLRIGDGSACEFTIWMSSTSLRCKVGVYSSRSMQFVVTAGLLTSSTSDALSFDRVPIFVDFSSAVVSSHFLVSTSCSVIRIGESVPWESKWISETTVECRVVTGIHRSLRLLVTLSGGLAQETQTHIFSFHSVGVSAFSANMQQLLGHTRSLTVTGRSFGILDYSGNILHGQTSSQASEWLSESSVICKSGQVGKGSLSVILTTGFQSGSFTQAGSFDSLSGISCVFCNAPTADTAAIVVRGGNLGLVDYSLRVSVGCTSSRASAWTSTNSVVCRVALSIKSTRSLVLTSQRCAASSTAIFSHDTMTLSRILIENSREKWRKWISLTGSPCWPSASANHRQTG